MVATTKKLGKAIIMLNCLQQSYKQLKGDEMRRQSLTTNHPLAVCAGFPFYRIWQLLYTFDP